MSGTKPRIVVMGAAYMDIAIRAKEVPVAGETVAGSAVSCRATGAGINQATQAHFCGCVVNLIAKVGNDPLGEIVRKNLESFEIETNCLHISEAKPTGVILTFVNAMGENAVAVAPGANSMLRSADVEEAESAIASANAVLLHAEMPQDAVITAIRLARLHKVKVLLDPAFGYNGLRSHSDLPIEYFTVDVLLPNVQEAAELADEPVGDIHKAKLIGSDLVARGAENVVIKMGRRGCLIVNRQGTEHIAPYEVEMVDKTCAGDAFAGALAACYAVCGGKIAEAVRFAAAAGALACTKFGCQEALPRKDEILELLHSVYTD